MEKQHGKMEIGRLESEVAKLRLQLDSSDAGIRTQQLEQELAACQLELTDAHVLLQSAQTQVPRANVSVANAHL